MQAIASSRPLVVAAAAATAMVAACGGGGSGPPPPTRIVPSEYDQVSPAVHGSSVVWEDSRNDATNGTDLFMYDTAGANQSLVAGGKGEQEQPAISDRYIVWIDRGRLRARDRTSGTEFYVAAGGTTQTDPAVCGPVVTWTNSSSGTSDVYARDLVGGAEVAVASSPAVEAYPACDAGRVVYMHAPEGQSADIRLYDLATGQTTVVAGALWNEWQPAISGDRVVWQAWPNQPDTTEGIQILGKRLSTGQGFDVTTGPGHQTAPVISGSVVAWEDARNGDSRVWWRDLASTTGERQVASGQAGDQQAPALSGRSLAYQSNAMDAWNIYLVSNLPP